VTSVLGALMAIAVLSNVVMLNLAYDVPVKFYSLNLLFSAVFLAAPDLPRIARAILAPEVGPAYSGRSARLVGVGSVVASVALVSYFCYAYLSSSLESARDMSWSKKTVPLYGIWVLAGTERQTAAGGDIYRIAFAYPKSAEIQFADRTLAYASVALDPQHHHLILRRYKVAQPLVDVGYVESTGMLTLIGTVNGERKKITLRRFDESKFELLRHPFRWLNSYPDNH
jgi:hypothetical protein